MSSLRAFFVALFGVFGALAALCIAFLLLYGIFAISDEQTFSSDVKILPDAAGSREKLSSSTPIILQLTLDGAIGSEKLTGKKVEEMLLDSRENAFEKDRVKAILLVINSPGGSVNDSDIIYRHIKEYKERFDVPVYTYIDGMCASGGFYIACASDQIYASDVSLVGSIGVLAWPPFMNVVDTLEKVGVNTLTLSAGKGKDELNPFRPWKDGEQEDYQRLINYFYGQFVAIVADNRPVDREEIEEKLGAKVYPAPEAKEMGLIDAHGASRSSTLTALAKEAGVEKKYQVVGFETTSWWKKALKEEPASPFITGKIKHELALPFHEGNPFSYR